MKLQKESKGGKVSKSGTESEEYVVLVCGAED